MKTAQELDTKKREEMHKEMIMAIKGIPFQQGNLKETNKHTEEPTKLMIDETNDVDTIENNKKEETTTMQNFILPTLDNLVISENTSTDNPQPSDTKVIDFEELVKKNEVLESKISSLIDHNNSIVKYVKYLKGEISKITDIQKKDPSKKDPFNMQTGPHNN